MIQDQISEIFHQPTPLTRDELSFANTNIESIKRWSSKLSITRLGDTSEAVFKALYEIAELKCCETLRFDLIQSLHSLIENVLESLEKSFFNQGLNQSDRNKDIIDLSTRFRTFFANIYIDIAQRSEKHLSQQKFSLFNYNHRRNLKTARILASYYALEQLGQLFLQQQMLYRSALSKQWLITHRIYNLALKNQETHININQLQGTNHVVKNIQQAYARVLLLEIFNTHQIRPSEIYALYQCSQDWAQLIHLSQRETTLSRYMIDTHQDYRPIYSRKPHENFKANIFISTQSLLEHVNLTIQQESEYLSKLEKTYLTVPLKFHVQNVLGTTTERQHERYEYTAQLQICFGLATAHYYLSGQQNFFDTLNIQSYAFKKVKDHAQSTNVIGITEEQLNQKVLEPHSKQIYQNQVLDISIHGYRVRWLENEAPSNLKTGEFILMNESATAKWRSGVIRWIKQSVHHSYEIGLEIIGQNILPCAVKVNRVFADRSNFDYQPSIIVQNQKLGAIQFSLVLPNLSAFKVNQSIVIRMGDEEINVTLAKPRLITQSFVHFDFDFESSNQIDTLLEFFEQQTESSDEPIEAWDEIK